MTGFRLTSGPACIAITKQILNELASSVLRQSDDSNMLHKTDAVRGKIAEVSRYGSRFIIFHSFISADHKLVCDGERVVFNNGPHRFLREPGLRTRKCYSEGEKSYTTQFFIVLLSSFQVFCSQKCLDASLTALDVIGSPAISESHWANKFHRDAVRHLLLHETNDSLKIMSALFGLQYSGVSFDRSFTLPFLDYRLSGQTQREGRQAPKSPVPRKLRFEEDVDQQEEFRGRP